MGDYDEPGSPSRALQRLAHGAEPSEAVVEAHEWYCPQCKFYFRLEFGPLNLYNGECSKCKGPVEYNGIVEVLRSRVGIKDSIAGPERGR